MTIEGFDIGALRRVPKLPDMSPDEFKEYFADLRRPVNTQPPSRRVIAGRYRRHIANLLVALREFLDEQELADSAFLSNKDVAEINFWYPRIEVAIDHLEQAIDALQVKPS